ncbi:MAG: DUF4135 domain-containing protein [Acidobacteriota bacterium]|nr:DUF4135 domain-containing protein [Acidobacteriota bacterium]
MITTADIPYRYALTLEELTVALTPRTRIPGEKGRERLERWRESGPGFTGDGFHRRLQTAGLEADDLAWLLEAHNRDHLIAAGEPPAWLHELTEAMAAPGAFDPLPLPEALKNKKGIGFVQPAAPLIHRALQHILARVRELLADNPRLPFDPEKLPLQLCEHLLPGLANITERTLVLEMHIARMEGSLDAETPRERFAQYMASLSRTETVHALFAMYPALARQLTERIGNWQRFCLETLECLAEDWEQIDGRFFQNPGKLTAFDFSAGDTHRQGRSVVLLRFSSGTRLVYKPRNMAVDVHFQQLLAWLDERGDFPALRTMDILSRPQHGWVEYWPVSAPCVGSWTATGTISTRSAPSTDWADPFTP